MASTNTICIHHMATSRKIAAIPYYGGKFRLARHIVPIVESIPHTVYVEPCVGGGSVFLWREEDPKRIDVLNDIDQHIVVLYRAMKLFPLEFLMAIDSLPYSRTVFDQSPLPIQKPILLLEPQETIAIAASVYFKLCTSFAADLESRGMNITKPGRSPHSNHWQNKISNLQTVISRFKSVHLDRGDVLTVLDRWDSRDCLAYIDPPYPGTHCAYSAQGNPALYAALSIYKGSYVLSGYAMPAPPQCNVIAAIGIPNAVDRTKPTPTEYLYIKTFDLVATLAVINTMPRVRIVPHSELHRSLQSGG